MISIADTVPNLVVAQQQPASPTTLIGYVAIFMLLMYVMLIRPQKRKDKERKELIAKVKSGDRILFGGGIIGTVANVRDNSFIVKVADKTKIEIVRGAVLRVLDKGETPADAQQE